jgi:predicted ester cyclase
VATDDQVDVRATVSGTHSEPLMGLAPTGRSFEIDYVWFCRIEEGQIAEIWSLPDGLGVMQQFGAVPGGSRFRPQSN